MLLALSGGVDSSVVAALLVKAVGKQLTCVHVNHGLLRKGEPEEVVRVFRTRWMQTWCMWTLWTASWISWLAWADPETKRKVIGARVHPCV